jgi:hypothetical protein
MQELTCTPMCLERLAWRRRVSSTKARNSNQAIPRGHLGESSEGDDRNLDVQVDPVYRRIAQLRGLGMVVKELV